MILKNKQLTVLTLTYVKSDDNTILASYYLYRSSFLSSSKMILECIVGIGDHTLKMAVTNDYPKIIDNNRK